VFEQYRRFWARRMQDEPSGAQGSDQATDEHSQEEQETALNSGAAFCLAAFGV
jgi:hypothetical protein